MEPILISSLKKYVQNAILNNQEKLNPHKDAYIDETEIGELLNYFGAKDISELMDTGLDTFEKTTDSEKEQPATTEEMQQNETEEMAKVLGDASKQKAGGFDITGSAAEELSTLVSSDIILASSGTPFCATYQNLIDKANNLEAAGEDTIDIETQIATIEKQIQEYIRENQIDINELIKNGEATIFTYGDGKKGIFVHSIDFGGNNAINAASNDQSSSENDETDGDQQTDTKNLLDGGFKYTAALETENTQIRGIADIQTDNTDLYVGATYNKKVNDDQRFSLALSGRETIEPGYSNGSGGIAIDYKNKNLSAGAYGFIRSEQDTEDNKYHEYQAEGYLKYKDNVRIAAGIETCDYANYPYLKAKLSGAKNIDNSGLKLIGSASAEVGKYNYDADYFGAEIPSDMNIEAQLKGGLSFKADDLAASLHGIFTYQGSYGKDYGSQDMEYDDIGSLSLFGTLTKGKFGISAMISAFSGEGNNITSSIMLQIKDFLKGCDLNVGYTLDGSNSGAQHNISAKVKFNLGQVGKH